MREREKKIEWKRRCKQRELVRKKTKKDRQRDTFGGRYP